MYPAFFDNFIKILSSVKENNIDTGFFIADGHRVDRNRDALVNAFLEREDKPDYLLMLDTDMEHPINIASRLMAWEQPIVGGLYFHRTSHNPFCFKKMDTEPDIYGREIETWRPMREEIYEFLRFANIPRRPGSLAINFEEDEEIPYGPLFEVDAVATGALLIHRDVLEKMEKPIFEYRVKGISEDLQFCMDAKEAGFPVYCDLSTISGHFVLEPQGFAKFMSKWENLGVQIAYHTPSAAAEILSKYWSIPLKKAQDILRRSSAAEVKDVWNKKPPTTDAEEISFYKKKETGEKYILELLHWNNSEPFVMFKNYIRRLRGYKILEIGAGIGTTALQLALQTNEVTVVEPNKQLRDFINWRIKDADERSSVTLASENMTVIGDINWWEKVPQDHFDVILCIDVFEHLPEKILKQNLAGMAGALRDQGRLIYHANFGQQDLYPMHHDYSEHWTEWMNEAGFAQINELEALLYKKEQ